MPYHPQYVEEGSQFEMALTAELEVPAEPNIVPVNLSEQQSLEHLGPVHSRLRTDLNSAKAKAGDPVGGDLLHASRSWMRTNQSSSFPRTASCEARFSAPRPRAALAATGCLRLLLQRTKLALRLPPPPVDATPLAIESSPDTKVAIDDEGASTQQADHSIAAPLLMGLLSAQALGNDDGALGSPWSPAMVSRSPAG